MKSKKHYTVSRLLGRLASAWVICLTGTLLMTDGKFDDKSFAFTLNTVIFLTATVLCFLALLLVKCDRTVTLVTLLFAAAYGALLCSKGQDGFFIPVCILLGAVTFFCKKADFSLHIGDAVLYRLIAVMAITFTLTLGISCCLRYWNYSTPCYDFGIFSQMFYSLRKCALPLTTCERDGLLSHFAVHASPIFYLLLPFYLIAPTPCTLLLAQSALTAIGVLPLIKLCKNHRLSNGACLMLAIIYFLYPCFVKSSFFYIHENNFLLPLTLFLLCAMEKEAVVQSLILTALILLVKEDAAVYTATVSVYFLFTRKNYKCNLSALLLSLIYFAAVLLLLKKYGEGAMTNRYENYMTEANGSLFAVIETAVKNPGYVLRQCFSQKKIIFAFQMLLPLGFLPIIGKKPQRLFLLMPMVLVNLMPNYTYQHDIGFQYAFASGALLFYLAVIQYADLPVNKLRKKLLLIGLLSSFVIFSCTSLPYMGYINNYRLAEEKRESINTAVSLIPDDASVAASSFLLPNLSQRDEVYMLEVTKHQAEYYVIDLRQAQPNALDKFQTDAYSELYLDDDCVAVYMSR